MLEMIGKIFWMSVDRKCRHGATAALRAQWVDDVRPRLYWYNGQFTIRTSDTVPISLWHGQGTGSIKYLLVVNVSDTVHKGYVLEMYGNGFPILISFSWTSFHSHSYAVDRNIMNLLAIYVKKTKSAENRKRAGSVRV